jgi:hypothetical protein
MEEDTDKLGVVKDHMPPWGVAGKEMRCCQFMLMHPRTPWKIQMRIWKWKQWKELGYVP